MSAQFDVNFVPVGTGTHPLDCYCEECFFTVANAIEDKRIAVAAAYYEARRTEHYYSEFNPF